MVKSQNNNWSNLEGLEFITVQLIYTPVNIKNHLDIGNYCDLHNGTLQYQFCDDAYQ